eukprot:scaffold43737_cov18-Prasinocladus_malaysianus.AAC.1
MNHPCPCHSGNGLRRESSVATDKTQHGQGSSGLAPPARLIHASSLAQEAKNSVIDVVALHMPVFAHQDLTLHYRMR